MENFSQPMMQPSDFHSSHSSRNIIITVIVIAAVIFFFWKYKDSIFNSTTVSGLDPQKKAVMEAVIKGKTAADINILLHTAKDGPIVVKNKVVQPTNQVSEYDKQMILKGLMAK